MLVFASARVVHVLHPEWQCVWLWRLGFEYCNCFAFLLCLLKVCNLGIVARHMAMGSPIANGIFTPFRIMIIISRLDYSVVVDLLSLAN